MDRCGLESTASSLLYDGFPFFFFMCTILLPGFCGFVLDLLSFLLLNFGSFGTEWDRRRNFMVLFFFPPLLSLILFDSPANSTRVA